MRTKLRKYRKLANLTQETLAEQVGMSQVNISRIELGRVNPPTDVANKIVRVLNENGAVCDLQDVFGEEQFRPEENTLHTIPA